MQVLVTGATGYIGSAVASALAAAGHHVHALAHSGDVAGEAAARGLTPAAGDLRDAAGLEALAAGFDAVVHAANTGGADAAAVDARAAHALLRGTAARGGTLVYTSGVWVLGEGRSDERSPTNAPALVAWRPRLEAEISAAGADARVIIVRPGIVYGRGAGIPGMIAAGQLPVIGDGRQRWPLVHVDDLAELYVRALGAPAGSILHGVSETLSMGDLGLLAAAGGRAPVARIPLAEARARFGDFADALALDQQVDSQVTRVLAGWQPARPSPVEEFLAGSYAETAAPAAAV